MSHLVWIWSVTKRRGAVTDFQVLVVAFCYLLSLHSPRRDLGLSSPAAVSHLLGVLRTKSRHLMIFWTHLLEVQTLEA